MIENQDHNCDTHVNFEYCSICDHAKKGEHQSPCSDCLDCPTNGGSRFPVHCTINGKAAAASIGASGEKIKRRIFSELHGIYPNG